MPALVVAACHPKLFATVVPLVVETGRSSDKTDKTPSILSPRILESIENLRPKRVPPWTKPQSFASRIDFCEIVTKLLARRSWPPGLLIDRRCLPASASGVYPPWRASSVFEPPARIALAWWNSRGTMSSRKAYVSRPSRENIVPSI